MEKNNSINTIWKNNVAEQSLPTGIKRMKKQGK